MNKQEIIINYNIEESLTSVLKQYNYDKLFVLVDENTSRYCFPLIQSLPCMKNAIIICISAGDIHKNIETLLYVWKELSNNGATRYSLLINLGGGMVTDLGGFTVSTFKRGIQYINIPTTLLGMVDAAIGGKTGINFNGLKNEIGVFSPAQSVLISTQFLKTLNTENIFSGYAEMLKHGIISNTEHWNDLMNFNMKQIDYQALQTLVSHSVNIKEEIVAKDPFEKNIRKALNLGHTVGHAFESLALENNQPVLHGHAVAWGIVCELYLSYSKIGFPKDKLRQTIQFIKENYGVFTFDCKQYDRLYEFMTHDKKNSAGSINFTLMGEIGDIRINQSATKEEIMEMFDIFFKI